jgi:biopolymer transport protein ExbD
MPVSRGYDFYGIIILSYPITKLFMAQINTDINQPKQHRAGVKRMKKHLLKIDMTPMVDLGFLLISFFVITTELSKPRAMNLYMPADGPPMPLGESNAMTVLLDGNSKIWYYHGDWKTASAGNAVYATSYSGQQGLRQMVIEKQKQLASNPKNKEGRDGLMVMVKANEKASYENVVDVLDEMAINGVKKYALVKITPEETSWLRQRFQD